MLLRDVMEVGGVRIGIVRTFIGVVHICNNVMISCFLLAALQISVEYEPAANPKYYPYED